MKLRDLPDALRALSTDCLCAAPHAVPFPEYANHPSPPLRRVPICTAPQTDRRSASTDRAAPDKSCLPAGTAPSRWPWRSSHLTCLRQSRWKCSSLSPSLWTSNSPRPHHLQPQHPLDPAFPFPEPPQSPNSPARTASPAYFSGHTHGSSLQDFRPAEYPCRGRPCSSKLLPRLCALPAR